MNQQKFIEAELVNNCISLLVKNEKNTKP